MVITQPYLFPLYFAKFLLTFPSQLFSNAGERVAIKKITNVFDHVSDATRILREIKLLRLLRHPDIVEIKHIMLPPSQRDFKDIYVVFELMETDLHQVIKANDDLTPEHHQFFLYQMLLEKCMCY